MVFVILGMHKSGTTLLAQTFHLSGINMIDEKNVMESVYERIANNPGDEIFKREVDEKTYFFFERRSVNSLNHRILMQGQAKDVTSSFFVPKAIPDITDSVRKNMCSIITDCEEKHLEWGFKDPRMCLTYVHWLGELPPHKIIVIYRGYKGLLNRYNVTNRRQINLYRLWKILRSWVYYNSRIIEYLSTTKSPYIVLNYESFMTSNNEFERLEKFMTRPLVDCRKVELYRRRSDEPLPIMNLVERSVSYLLEESPDRVMQKLDYLRSISLCEGDLH